MQVLAASCEPVFAMTGKEALDSVHIETSQPGKQGGSFTGTNNLLRSYGVVHVFIIS